MKEIGGYLELVLHSLGPVRRLWVPYFTCNTVLDPVKKLGIAFSRYKIDRRLEVEGLPLLKEGEFFIYTNYFGLKGAYVDGLAECSSSQIEYRLAAEVAFLPLDQRYDKHDMQHIIDLLDKWKWK